MKNQKTKIKKQKDNPLTKLLWKETQKVLDPELNISIVDLGLVYDISIDKKGKVTVLMTLTTMGCPLFDLIAQPIKSRLLKVKGITDVQVELTFDPPWNLDLISDKAKIKLGYI
jgi:metal-sulfur cluster biosynthetic enzyme